jgi:fructose-1-phosphate kinase PfkB-like protein
LEGIGAELIGISAGRVGLLIEQLAADEGLLLEPLRVVGESRIAAIIVGGEPARSLVINPPGPTLTAVDWERLVAHVRARIRAHRPEVLICAGSLPPGVPADGYNEILLEGRAASAVTVVDAAADVLKAALVTRPSIVKVNLDEASDALGLMGPARNWHTAATSLHHAGAQLAVVTAGSHGALGQSETEAVVMPAPTANVRAATGAGDTFLAGFVAARLNGSELRGALRAAVAASAASVETLRPGYFDVQRRDALREGLAGRSSAV